MLKFISKRRSSEHVFNKISLHPQVQQKNFLIITSVMAWLWRNGVGNIN